MEQGQKQLGLLKKDLIGFRKNRMEPRLYIAKGKPLALGFLRMNSDSLQEWFSRLVYPSHETLFLQKIIPCLQNL